jgi:hypothetical protein
MGLATLRERLALVLIANREYERLISGATKFATVNVAVPATVATRVVAPNVVPPTLTAVTPTSVPITLDQWQEAPFAMDDKGLVQVDNGIIPMQAKEAIKSLANTIEDYLWSLLTAKVAQFAGTSGVTPFGSDLGEFLAADKLLNDSLADPEDRYMVLNTASKANAMGLRAIQDASFRSGKGPNSLISGEIGDILGARWIMSQRVPNHVAGTLAGVGTTVTGANAVGATVIALSGGAEVVSKKATFAQNILIQKNALAFAMAPLLDTVEVPGATLQQVAIDEVSGLSLRLEVSRQHRQVQWAFDALWGGTVVRPQVASWVAG